MDTREGYGHYGCGGKRCMVMFAQWLPNGWLGGGGVGGPYGSFDTKLGLI